MQQSIVALASAQESILRHEVKPEVKTEREYPDGTELLEAALEAESTTLTYYDGQQPNMGVHPHLDMFQDQFLCQYAYSVTDNPADHQTIWSRVADECALNIKMYRIRASLPLSLDPAPEGMICALRSIPVMLGVQSDKPRRCGRCGRMGLTRIGMVSISRPPIGQILRFQRNERNIAFAHCVRTRPTFLRKVVTQCYV